jgi:hypothetical protein
VQRPIGSEQAQRLRGGLIGRVEGFDASSDRVTSIGVPNTVVVLNSERSPRSLASTSGTTIAAPSGRGSGPAGAGGRVSLPLVVQRDQRQIGAKVDLPAQAREQMAPPGGEVGGCAARDPRDAG